MDAATVAVDTTNEGTPANPIYNQPLAAAPTVGKTIADQLVAAGMSWKTYQEDLGIGGPDHVNVSDGTFTNLSPVNQANLVAKYAVKHNPFVYFANVQGNTDPDNGFNNMVDFTGLNGLYADLATGKVPNFSFIAPNQCHDMHGQGNGGAFCGYDDPAPNNNPALIQAGDNAVQKLVTAIEQSDVWKEGKNAIVVMFDENDFSSAAEPGRHHRRDQLRQARRAKQQAVQPFRHAQDPGSRFWPGLPEPCLRQERGNDERHVRALSVHCV